ncbi:unnamed protein product [Meloidogyne enterolobii]|uniref:Uncharacterized protein n=1 Tax=Meloidogyne enterolobii TaxID=390850 RepID=A0ACB0ZER8_MELEN
MYYAFSSYCQNIIIIVIPLPKLKRSPFPSLHISPLLCPSTYPPPPFPFSLSNSFSTYFPNFLHIFLYKYFPKFFEEILFIYLILCIYIRLIGYQTRSSATERNNNNFFLFFSKLFPSPFLILQIKVTSRYTKTNK